MARKKHTEDTADEDLNLIPIMNLVVCLIPIILFGTVLVKVGVVNVSAPPFGPDRHAVAQTERPFNLTLGISDAGFRLHAGVDLNELLERPPAAPDASGRPTTGLVIPKKGDTYDYVALYNALMAIKEVRPKESLLKVTADRHIPFKTIVKAMDATRFQLEQSAYSDLDAYAAADIRRADGRRALLWPDIVFATVQ